MELKEKMHRREMHKAVCADRGKECEVPFRPDGSTQCTAENAILSEDLREDIRLIGTVFAKNPAFHH